MSGSTNTSRLQGAIMPPDLKKDYLIQVNGLIVVEGYQDYVAVS